MLAMAKSVYLLVLMISLALMISLRKSRHRDSEGLEDRKDFQKISFLLVSLGWCTEERDVNPYDKEF